MRLLEIPLNSSLAFQKLLFYHGTFDLLYAFLMGLANVHKMMVTYSEDVDKVGAIFILTWFPLELFRLNFGYKGNINETFPELIAFQIFTIFFIAPMSIVPLMQQTHYPHERCLIFINLGFVFLEFFFGAVLIRSFI